MSRRYSGKMMTELAYGKLRKEAMDFFAEAIDKMLSSDQSTIEKIPIRFLLSAPTKSLSDVIRRLITRYDEMMVEMNLYRKALGMYEMFVSMARMAHANSHHRGAFEDCQESPCVEVMTYSRIVDQALQGARDGST